MSSLTDLIPVMILVTSEKSIKYYYAFVSNVGTTLCIHISTIFYWGN